MTSVIAVVAGVLATRSGIMKGTRESVFASTSSSSGNGFVSLTSIVRSSGAAQRSTTRPSNLPNSSAAAKRCRLAVQSTARTGVLSWKRRPSRSLMRQVRPSADVS